MLRIKKNKQEDGFTLLEFVVVATPYADACEAMAQAMEDQDNLEEAEKFRRAKYYLIVTDRDEDGAPINNTARITTTPPAMI